MTREFSRCLIDRQIAEKFIFVQNRSERLLILNLFISNLWQGYVATTQILSLIITYDHNIHVQNQKEFEKKEKIMNAKNINFERKTNGTLYQ